MLLLIERGSHLVSLGKVQDLHGYRYSAPG